VTAALGLYSAASWAFEPLAGSLLDGRVKRGKERVERVGERLGRATLARPKGPLIWMHAASVGESRLLLDLFEALRSVRRDLAAVVTTQTLTSADMIVARRAEGVIHQMAPVDGPRAVRRFLEHWRPDAALFAEGEIWPNMLQALKRRRIPAALANARMTAKSIASWRSWAGAARELFGAFAFIGAADKTTAQGLSSLVGRSIDVVGNLKRASRVAMPDAGAVTAWRAAIGARPILLAASTHPGEDELVLDAFEQVRGWNPAALLIIAPRHPTRGPHIAALARGRRFNSMLRSADNAAPAPGVDVLVADTMGELMFWYAVSDAVYLGGASAADVGGHNPLEPAHLGKRAFTGPHGFNFQEMFDELAAANAITIGRTATELSQFWHAELHGRAPADRATLAAFLAEGRAPFAATVDAVLALLPPLSVKE
jgi:3-deoxy-D-manno-octulosonic-acid transferase